MTLQLAPGCSVTVGHSEEGCSYTELYVGGLPTKLPAAVPESGTVGVAGYSRVQVGSGAVQFPSDWHVRCKTVPKVYPLSQMCMATLVYSLPRDSCMLPFPRLPRGGHVTTKWGIVDHT